MTSELSGIDDAPSPTSDRIRSAIEKETTDDAPTDRRIVDSSHEIDSVDLFARGAVVRRKVLVDADLPEECEIAVTGLTPFALPNSARVRWESNDVRISQVKTRVHYPERDEGPGPSVEKVRELQLDIERVRTEKQIWSWRRDQLQQGFTNPDLADRQEDAGVAAHLDEVADVADVISEELERVDTRIVELEEQLEALQRELNAAELEDRQTSDDQRHGAGRPTREFLLRARCGSATGPLEIEFSYRVPHVRWWPSYTLRLDPDEARAQLSVDGLVVQHSGEQWEEVALSLSTAEPTLDARLPELPSLRIGRHQPQSSTGYRQPPDDLEQLFANFDRSIRALNAPDTDGPSSPATAASDELTETGDFSVTRERAAVSATDQPNKKLEAESGPRADTQVVEAQEVRAAQQPTRTPSPSTATFGAVQPPGAPPKSAPGRGGAPGEPPRADNLAPSDEWLDFEALELPAPTEPGRGKLRRSVREIAPAEVDSNLSDAVAQARRLGVTDPLDARGAFDQRIRAKGPFHVPSDGRLHRLELLDAQCDVKSTFWTVPRKETAVYREIVFDNPFDLGLLMGPATVYVDDELRAQSELDRVDRGGKVRIGAGVDERIEVARNARVDESASGWFRGKRTVSHEVEIELRSNVGFEAEVHVIDRIPVCNDDVVDVSLEHADPRPSDYSQMDRGRPVEGAKIWTVRLEPGAERRIEFHYDVVVDAKHEIYGGNRRE